ncbi:hypothetical protein [Priestia flexa]|uniref:hypothetical protein n=1 Tax=Priestia flexa TaxID=86664 RepID=UPI000473D8CE|nr:hypothetical protein [Priestia flexa]
MGFNGSNATNNKVTELHKSKNSEQERQARYEAMAKGYADMAYINLEEANAAHVSGNQADVVINEFVSRNNK